MARNYRTLISWQKPTGRLDQGRPCHLTVPSPDPMLRQPPWENVIAMQAHDITLSAGLDIHYFPPFWGGTDADLPASVLGLRQDVAGNHRASSRWV